LLGPPNIDIVTFSIVKGLQNWANVFVMQLPQTNEIVPLASIKMQTQDIVSFKNFYSQNINNNFNESWGKNELVYTDDSQINYEFEEFSPELTTDSNISLFYIHQRNATSKTIPEAFVSALSDRFSGLWQRIKTNFEGKEVTISYSDRYVLSKFSAMIVLQFIQKFSQILNLEIENLQLNFQPVRDDNRTCLKVWENWNTNAERISFIKNAVLDMDLVIEDDLVLNVSARSSHYRQLVIESENHVLTIQPDGGISHGWRFDRAQGDYHDGDYDLVESDEEMNIFNTTRHDGIQYIVELEME